MTGKIMKNLAALWEESSDNYKDDFRSYAEKYNALGWETNRLDEDCQMLCRLAMALDWPGENLPALLLSVYRYSMYHYADRISVAPAPPGAQCLNACARRLALGGRPREVAAPVRAM